MTMGLAKQLAWISLAIGVGAIGLYLLLFTANSNSMSAEDVAFLRARYPGGELNQSRTVYTWCQVEKELRFVMTSRGSLFEDGRCWK
jgi:hypothetical protein